mgnify:CR=1 FL=1
MRYRVNNLTRNTLLADQAAFRARRAALEDHIAATRAHQEAAAIEWAEAWRPLALAPRSPREMRQWLSDFKVLAEMAAEALKRAAEAAALAEEVGGCRAMLALGLHKLGEPAAAEEGLSGLVRKARQLVEKEAGINRKAEELSRERERLVEQLRYETEEIEAACIIDTLRRAGADVTVASVDKLQVTASRGMKLVADTLIADCASQTYDCIALPGGMPGAEHLRDCGSLIAMLKKQKQAGVSNSYS